MMDPWQSAGPHHRTGAPNHQQGDAEYHECNASLPIFDAISTAEADEGRRRRDDGMRTAEHASHPWVKEAMDRAIERWAKRREPFTSDDVRDEVEVLASSAGLLGARINSAARRGLIRKTGTYRQSRRASRHGGVVAEWIGADGGGS